MSTKGFTVRLGARVDQYVSAMEQAKKATTGFSEATSKNLAKAGATMQQVGGTMTRRVTLPLVAMTTAAGKLGYDFDMAFGRMVGLANVSADAVDGLKDSVLDLAGQTAVAPQELADALYFAASAGLDTAGAMDAVTSAAKASAAGMGETADVVGLVASAVASYGAGTIDAARATDILTATVRAGRADPSELAGSLGRILPVAAQLGVSFDQVGGATAYLSNVFGDTGRTVTAMSGFLNKLVAPTTQGRQALLDMGTSVEQLQQVIRDDGLLGALELLRTKGFAGNQIALRALFDDVEGYQGALALLNDANGRLVPTMDEVTNSTGALGTAYDAVASTDAFKLKSALNDLKVVLTDVGGDVLPMAADAGQFLAEAIGSVVDIITGLPDPLQHVVIGLIGMAAAAGPVLSITGGMIRNLETMKGGLGLVETGLARVGISASAATTALGAIGIAIASAGIAYTAYQSFTASQREVAQRASEVAAGLDAATDAAIRNATATDRDRVAHIALSDALTGTGDDGKKLTMALGTLGLTTDKALDSLVAIGKDPVSALRKIAEEAGISTDAARQLADVVSAYDDNAALGSAFEGIGSRLGIPVDRMTELGKAMEELQDQSEKTNLDAMIRGFLATDAASAPLRQDLLGQAEAQTELRRSGTGLLPLYEAYTALLSEHASELDLTTTATDAATSSMDNFGSSTAGATVAASDLADSLIDPIDNFNKAAAAADTFKSALEAVFGPARSIEQSQQDWAAGTDRLTESFKKNGRTLDINTEKGRANRDAVKDQVDNLNTFITSMVESGMSMEEAAGYGGALREELIAQLDQLGLTREQAEQYLATLGMTPEQIQTAVELAHSEQAKQRVEDLLASMGDLPESTALEIQALIDSGAFDEAERRILRIQTMAASKASLPVLVNVRGGATPVPQAEGGFWDHPVFAMLGEAGDEVVLPLTRPGRMAQLLADPRVGPKVLAALGGKATRFANGGGVFSGSDGMVSRLIAGLAPSAGGDPAAVAKLMSNRFEAGDLSSGDYRAFLTSRLAATEKFSDDWMSVWREIRGLDDDAKKADEDQLKRDAEIQAAMLETGAISTSAYEQFLQKRLGLFEQYSADWMQTWRELQTIQQDELAANDDLIKSSYDRANAAQDLIEAEHDLADAVNASNDAAGKLAGLGRDATADERSQSQRAAEDARRKVAETAFKGAGARANANGLADGTVEWARFIRGEVTAYAAANPDLAGRLNELLAGVPAFAGGGFIKARPGGMLARLGEAGQDEWVFNRRQLTAFSDTAAARSSALSSTAIEQVVAKVVAGMPSGGVSTGDVIVGSRDDLRAVDSMFQTLAWRARQR